MRTLAGFGRSPAASPGRRPPSGTVGFGAVVLALAGLTATALLLPHHAQAVRGALGLLFTAATTAFLLARAPRTATPAGWRWFAAAIVVSSIGAAAVPALTGQPATNLLGLLPGQLLIGAAMARMRPGGTPRPGRAQLLTTGPLFLLATLLAMHVATDLVPHGPGSSALFLAAVDVIPVGVALSTTFVLLFAAGSPPERQTVAVCLLVAQALSGFAGIASLLAWTTGSATAQALVWPAVLGSFAAICLGCLRDRPLPAPGPGRTQAGGALTALLPHVMALIAGSLLLLRVFVTGAFDAYDAGLAVLGLGFLVANQAVMWATTRRLTDDLQRSESFFRTLVKSSVDPVVILDDQLQVSFASPTLWNLLGVDAAGAVGRSLGDVVHPDDAAILLGALREQGDHDAAVRTARLRHADGSWRLIQCTVRDLRRDPDVGALVLFCRDVTPRTRALGMDPELLELSLTDPVTGLPNRTALVRRLGALQRAEGGARPAALALIGVSGLAEAAVLAPGAEDAALRALTSRLTRALRGEDWLARGANGDFVLLVDGSIAHAEVVAARLVSDVGELMTAAGPLELTAAAGVTGLLDDLDPGEVLRRCSVALHSAQLAGAGSVHRYDDALRMQQDRSDALRADLDGALQRGELRLVFQPVVDLALHRTVSVEALLRWRHPVFGDVPPVEFVPLAEQSPLIGDLGRWVLREACATVAALADTDLGVAVNVSARQVRSGELVPDVLAALESSGLPASRLIVEITESVLMDDGQVIEDLTVLRQLGVRIAVDDFGTGWSSLAYLVGLPIDLLKMDQHFVTDVEHDTQRQALCRAVLQLGTSLGLPVIVEGVTTQAELGLLRDMGHRYLQGFVFSRPLEVAQLAAGAWRAGGSPPVAVPAPGAEAMGAATVAVP